MNTHCAEKVKSWQAQMYGMGYPYSAWVVRRRLFGLGIECSLQFLSEEPRGKDLEAVYGPRVVKVQAAP